MKKITVILSLLLVALTSCNKDREFPDYDYQTVYFAYQYPVRTITLGEDLTVNTDLDNAHKCKVFAATGGVYYSKHDVNITVAVDKTLLGNGMLFDANHGGGDILPLPDKYFTLASNTITIPKGELAGGVEVQLTDAFFDDPLAIGNNYVLPLKITGVAGADSVLSGRDFVLYAIRYVNTWHGNYLRRGKDIVTGSLNQTVVRHKQYVEQDEVNKITTRSLKQGELPVVFKDKDGANINCTLLLSFNDNGNCTVSSATTGITASGSGSFVKKGEKNSWGAKDRDAIYLNYQVDLPGMHVATTDTLVARDRAVTMDTFSPRNK
ncbi:DUF5627 domain-containing protein [Filimonas effusa]|uniref:DUF1735 domain-containing protein n=1 Tax=Filimonas effusa TaxID=2508721 RepID=A0A4Q1D0B7_9BACT|nr:DUF5627 domain-containing protein [Filimonas effusa]RXK81183.1 DUF1735 domain-containing protein [Filimonas effusa]